MAECECEPPRRIGRYQWCHCNSASEEPCSYCDWVEGHDCPDQENDDDETDRCAECACHWSQCRCSPKATNKRAESVLESMRWVADMMNSGNVNAKDVYPPDRYHGD